MIKQLFQRLAYSPWYAQLVVIRRCNLRCGYCNEYDGISNPVPLEDLKDRARRLKSLGTFAINLTGGEPSLHPDLPDLIRCCREELKFLNTSLITNGFLLDREVIRAWNHAGLQALQISIDGVRPSLGTVKVLDRLAQKLELLRDVADFKVVVSAVVGACPPEETLEVLRFSKKLGFRPRILFLHDAAGEIQSQGENEMFEEILDLVPNRFPEFSGYQRGLNRNGQAPFKCRGGSRYLYVNENGMVSRCSQTRQWFQKDLTDYSLEDLKAQFYAHKPCQDRCTLGCVRAASYPDSWRLQDPL